MRRFISTLISSPILMIRCIPTRDRTTIDEYYEKYVLPRGNPRCAIKGDPVSGLTWQCNPAGFMEFFRIIVQVASERGGGWELLPLEKSEEGWIGDTEPGSSLAGIWLKDVEFWPIDIFEYSPPFPPVMDGRLRLDWKHGYKLSVGISGSRGAPMYDIWGNQNGLLSLAMHFATLAQDSVPDETENYYKPGSELEPNSLPLTIKRAIFDEHVPLAKAR